MGLADKLRRHRQITGAGLSDYVPPRINQNGQLEMHLPFANYAGPKTDVIRRLRENVKPTIAVDAGAQKHDIQYHNIGVQLAKGQITRAQAINKVKASDNQLLKCALYNKLSPNPINNLHSTAVLAGIGGKKVLQGIGAMDELKFIDPKDGELLEGGRRKAGRKRNLVKGLQKRFKGGLAPLPSPK